MNKPLLGLLLGGVLGMFDGSTAFWTAPELRPEILGIIGWSAVKGLVAGIIIGFATRRVFTIRTGVLVGLGVAVLLTIPVAVMNVNYYENTSYYWKILLPGALTGLLVGYGTVRYGRQPASTTT